MVKRLGPGDFELVVFLPRASTVSLAGTFNQWTVDGCAMTRDDDGWWRARLTLDDGDHAFQYVIDGHEWMADFAAGGVERNGFGCWVSLLSVDRTSRRERTLDRELTAILGLLNEAADRLRAGSGSESLPFPTLARDASDEDDAERVASIEMLARLVA
jgi:hypothetical protein